MERADSAPVGTFYVPRPWGATVELDEAAAHHANVKRLRPGDVVRLTDGGGRRSMGLIVELAKRRMSISVDASSIVDDAPQRIVELWTPVGDRDRMLWLAEKAVELGVSVWRPILYQRSRSVSPRGEGEAFNEKVRLRMVGALEQSGGAWLPTRHPETGLQAALAAARGVEGIVLDGAAEPIRELRLPLSTPVALAFGPEGGFAPEERHAFADAGWRAGSLGPNVLRFETAGIAALAIIRSLTS